jgi:hypothetical protein
MWKCEFYRISLLSGYSEVDKHITHVAPDITDNIASYSQWIVTALYNIPSYEGYIIITQYSSGARKSRIRSAILP